MKLSSSVTMNRFAPYYVSQYNDGGDVGDADIVPVYMPSFSEHREQPHLFLFGGLSFFVKKSSCNQG